MSTPRPAIRTVKVDAKLRISVPTNIGRQIKLRGGDECEVYVVEDEQFGDCIMLRPVNNAA